MNYLMLLFFKLRNFVYQEENVSHKKSDQLENIIDIRYIIHFN
jgi:hypothetical protein